MADHDDFVDDYIEYRIFEESMKGSGGRKPPKKGGCSGCSTWIVVIVIAVIALTLLTLFAGD